MENVIYKTFVQRIARNPLAFNTKTQTREGGGKEQILIAVDSLSSKARKIYKTKQKVDGADIIIQQRTDVVPWYVEADLNQYIESHKKQYYEAIELVGKIQHFIEYKGDDKTSYADQYALALGVSAPTLYRYASNILEASAWALKLEKEDGQSRDYFRALSICRKPKEKATFPSLTDEQKAIIENIWFDSGFAKNLGTIEMLYEKFEEIAEERSWDGYPSARTVTRYIKYLMEQSGSESVRYLAANGTREWKNKMMVKVRRETASLEVMEYVVGDEHTFDIWVAYTAPNGKVKAVRPKLVAWMDVKTRTIIGDVLCVDANSQTLKESLIKMIYSNPGGVPKILHIDNGKDYTGETMIGQSRKKRKIEFDFDSETIGFYQSIGIQEVGRSLPYQPWDKSIERFFSTVCSKFSKWFESYTGTLTGSKTYAKRNKDINKMLEQGELLTMEEFFELWTLWKDTKYHTREHTGLKENHEQWCTPAELFENGPRYMKAVPPREYAAMLLMKADQALVRNVGIYKFGVLYSDSELGKYIGQTVGIKWDIDDVTKLYVYDSKGKKICEAVSATVLSYGVHCSQEALGKHMQDQKRQYKTTVEALENYTTPYEVRLDQGRKSDAVGKLDLTIKAKRDSKIVALPNDKEFRAEMAAPRKKKSGAGDEYFAQKAGTALARLRAMNE